MTTRTEADRDAAPREPREIRWLGPDEVRDGDHCESNRHFGAPPAARVRLFFGGRFGETLDLCLACYHDGREG